MCLFILNTYPGIQRIKLKNRVAAQSSRDRKKARMDELEIEVKELNQKYEELLARNEELEAQNRRLQEGARPRPRTRDVGCGPSSGPAASPADPLPRGQGPQPAAGPRAVALLLTCWLASRTCSRTWTMTTSTSWPGACSATQTSRWMPAAKQQFRSRWWGRHQKCWNPVGMAMA
ncbi:X-box-binding protein 1 [Bacillus rossius redtenbacheri]|uniref:X-box-binding protein 1 n=1 Tax=Bacillus rossius redtenbacheri TaxID=93214 RepID=UPI002FDDB849